MGGSAGFDDIQITRAIANGYHNKFQDRVVSDVLIVGAGPAGLTAAYYMSKSGLSATVIERKLAPGGGVWGGGMAMNDVVVQAEALPILDEVGVRTDRRQDGLPIVDAVEMASGLAFKAIQAGAAILNLMTVEDVCVYKDRVAGLVVNRTGISGVMHVDPVTFAAKAVIDGTGHDADVVEMLRKRGLISESAGTVTTGEGPMDAVSGEKFVVEHVAEIYPGLWVAGMSVCATFGGPRMGPIFGGMLLSGKRVAEQIIAAIA
jgi:sulfide-dependent adenosine diphosphate thiazole synthase